MTFDVQKVTQFSVTQMKAAAGHGDTVSFKTLILNKGDQRVLA